LLNGGFLSMAPAGSDRLLGITLGNTTAVPKAAGVRTTPRRFVTVLFAL
jgi:hypothetical protein